MGGKNKSKKFSKNTRLGYPKIVGKKSSGKSVKTRFYKHTNIVTKKWVEKKPRKIFSRNTCISRIINDGKKSSGKSAKTRFFYKHTNIVTKK